MHAMVMKEHGPPERLVRMELPDTAPGPGEVAIAVHASGVNFMDSLICEGRYQARPALPFAPGGEVAGEVVAIGDGVGRFRPGQRVYAALAWGGYASRAVAPEDRVFAIPDAMSFELAASFGIVYQTAWFGLVERAGLRRGETLLVHAAAGGAGLAAVQLGRALGARVLGTAGGADKCRVAIGHGAEVAIDYRSEDVVARVKAATADRGADVVFDPVGGDVFDASMKAIAFGGRHVVIGFASGRIPELAMNRVLLKNIGVMGLHWGLYFQQDPARVHAAMDALFELWARGELRPLVSATYPLERAAEAIAAISDRRTTGKVVLRVEP